LFIAAVLAATPSADALTFTRFANTTLGRTLFEIGDITVRPGTETWRAASKDVLPFDYEQGVDSDGGHQLEFNSRGTLYRTTYGCPAPRDNARPCYDVLAVNRTPISADEGAQGFNHIGDTSLGRSGPAAGFLFTPLEKSPGNGIDKIFKVFDFNTLKTAGSLFVPGPFSHHSWVMVDPSGNYLVNADATIRHLDVYRITRNPAPATPEERIVLTRAPELDVAIDAGISADIGPTGCSFLTDRSIYCADWVKEPNLKLDIRTDIYRMDLAQPVGAMGNTGHAALAFSYTVAHKHPSITYGLEGEGITFYKRRALGPVELHVLIRGEDLAVTNLVHFVPGPGSGAP
jgi:hypothetical protein